MKSKSTCEVTRRDIASPITLPDWALGRSIDELAEPSRRLLIALYHWTRTEAQSNQLAIGDVRFTRRAIRETLGWGSTQLAYHLERLVRWRVRRSYWRIDRQTLPSTSSLLMVVDVRANQPFALTGRATMVEPEICTYEDNLSA